MCNRDAVETLDSAARVDPDSAGGQNEQSFAELMDAMREGSEEAAFAIVERYSPHILRVIRASLPNSIRSKVDSVDLLNTLLGSLLTKRSRFERVREPAQLIALLTAAAKSRVIDEHRRYTRTASRDVRAERQGFDETCTAGVSKTSAVAGDGRLGGREMTPSQIVASREKWQTLLSRLDRREKRVLMLRIKGRTWIRRVGLAVVSRWVAWQTRTMIDVAIIVPSVLRCS